MAFFAAMAVDSAVQNLKKNKRKGRYFVPTEMKPNKSQCVCFELAKGFIWKTTSCGSLHQEKQRCSCSTDRKHEPSSSKPVLFQTLKRGEKARLYKYVSVRKGNSSLSPLVRHGRLAASS